MFGCLARLITEISLLICSLWAVADLLEFVLVDHLDSYTLVCMNASSSVEDLVEVAYC